MVEVEKKPLAGLIEVSLQSSISSATKLFSTYPLRILHPKKVQFDASVDCAWFYTVSYGGGLVSGDLVPMSVDVQKNCTASVCTQGTTKVYKSIKPSSTNGTEESGQQQRMESKRLSKRSRQKLERTRFSVGYRTRHSVSKTQSLSKCTRFHCRMILLAYVSWIGSPLGESHTTMRDGHFVCFPRERP